MRVTIEDISVRFGAQVILASASAVFPAGECTAIMGPSGAGKSTLLSVIAGVVRPDAGNVTDLRGERDVEWLVQSTPLLNRRTVIDNVRLSALLRGADEQSATIRAARAMHAVGVLGLARQRTSRLSGGEKQRVAIARAISSGVSVVLADEPTASLDTRSRERVMASLASAAESGAVVIIATHDDYVARHCDRVLHLDGGMLAEKRG